MARHYSAKTFLRNVPNALLQEYFASKSIDLGLEWVRLGETDVDHIFLALEKLPAPTRSLVDTEFSSINELACADGIAAILEEARLWGRNWADSFAGMTNHYERAFRTFLHEPQCFRVAKCFHEMDRRGGWRRRFVGYRLEASSDPEALRELEKGFQLFYRRQGRGRFCHVDCYSRQDPDRQCYFAYPEDYASTDVGYDDGGEFRRRPRRSALEIILVYRPEEGVLELCARGDKKQLLEMEEIFCRTILDLEELPDEQDRVPYELAILKNREFPFPTDPRDRITAVHVRQMRFDLRRPRGGRITVSANSCPYAPQALHDLIDEAIDQTHLPLDDLHVSQARLRLTFAPHNGERPKTLTFEVTYPDRCTLKDDPHDQIARRCLKEWGIARD